MTTDFLLTNQAVALAKSVIESAMSYTCDFEIPVDTGAKDEDNHPIVTWETYLIGQKCLVISVPVATSRTGEQVNVNTAFIMDRFLLYLPFGTGIKTTARISALYNRDGSIFDSTVLFYEIKERMPDEASTVYSIEAIH